MEKVNLHNFVKKNMRKLRQERERGRGREIEKKYIYLKNYKNKINSNMNRKTAVSSSSNDLIFAKRTFQAAEGREGEGETCRA